MASRITIEHEQHTDVAHVILCDAESGARIETIDIGADVGFPGLITARVDRERGILYGLNIENYSSFKRQVRWQNHMLSLKKALELIVLAVRAGLSMDHSHGKRDSVYAC